MNKSCFKQSKFAAQKDCLSAFLIIYLGRLPAYFEFWAKSCEPNHEKFHWYVYNDCLENKIEHNKAVTLVPYDFKTLCIDLKTVFNIHIHPANTRIVCDCRLMLYPIRKKKDNLEQYDFIGYSDIDVIYGQIARFMPEQPYTYSMISANDGWPCGPFTLFNKKYLYDICNNKKIKKLLESDHGNAFYSSKEYSDSVSKFKPMSGNRIKDKISEKINFTHLDESDELVQIAKEMAPVFCKADPLQPTLTKGFNHRKSIAFWDKGQLFVRDVFGHEKEGAFFHFSRLKNRTRFKVNSEILNSSQFGIYKYGFLKIKSKITKLKMLLSLLY